MEIKVSAISFTIKHFIMAEMETRRVPAQKGNSKKHHKSTRVDLTPMVDLGFLLITFFVFTTTMAKPRVMGIVSPKESTITTDVCESCVVTVIPTAGNVLHYYEGMLTANTQLLTTSYDAAGLRKILLDKKARVQQVVGNEDDMVLIVRPTNESNYKNFVDILDEAAITKVKHYFIDELTAAEKLLLAKN
jgi:biopolymer transport protein ExbD